MIESNDATTVAHEAPKLQLTDLANMFDDILIKDDEAVDCFGNLGNVPLGDKLAMQT